MHAVPQTGLPNPGARYPWKPQLVENDGRAFSQAGSPEASTISEWIAHKDH